MLKVGSIVRVATSEPSCGWGDATPTSIGYVASIAPLFPFDPRVLVNFPEQKQWKGIDSDLEELKSY